MRTTPAKARVLSLAVALVASACSGVPTTDEAPEAGGVSGEARPAAGPTRGPETAVVDIGADEIVLTARLVRFDSCGALLDQLRTWAADRVGPWGFGPPPEVAAMEESEEAPMEEAGPANGDSGAFRAQVLLEGVDYSGTNVQELGVDEADIIKTDGRRIFVVSAGRLAVVDADRREVLGSTPIASVSQAVELFLNGDSLLAVQHSDGRGLTGAETVIQRIDVRDGVPEIVETMRVEGSYVSARATGGTARVIVRSQPPQEFPFVYPAGSGSEAAAEEANRAVVQASTLEDWLPEYSYRRADGSGTEGLLPLCERVHAPTVFSGFGLTTVLNIGVAGAIDPTAATSVLAPGDTVYASPESVYVSTTSWVDPSAHEAGDIDWDQIRREWRTNIHRFDISDPAETVYAASGHVPGQIHNQFALSEHAGHLRVVTTTGDPRSGQSESWVRVLAESDGQLVEVGSAGDIGRGERVQSVRFAGDVGYVVTFRQIDPFYTVDLSDPTNPTVVGELKIPGFSSYLHPIGDGMVLGVGSEATEDGRVTGAKVSLFDVSDLADPREVSVWTAPGGWNEIGWDHRAFLWWAPESLAVVPVTVDRQWSGAIMLQVVDGAVSETGRIVHYSPDTGRTTCRQLNGADVIGGGDATQGGLGTRVAELLLQSPTTALIVACEPGESAVSGFDCERGEFSADEEESLRLRVDYGPEEELWACLPPNASEVPHRQIVRSIVIGDDLWTLSHPYDRYRDGSAEGLLQVNGLKTLEFLRALDV